MSVGWSVGRVTHSFDDPHVAPYWFTWPCFHITTHFQTLKERVGEYYNQSCIKPTLPCSFRWHLHRFTPCPNLFLRFPSVNGHVTHWTRFIIPKLNYSQKPSVYHSLQTKQLSFSLFRLLSVQNVVRQKWSIKSHVSISPSHTCFKSFPIQRWMLRSA